MLYLYVFLYVLAVLAVYASIDDMTNLNSFAERAFALICALAFPFYWLFMIVFRITRALNLY